MNIASCLSQRNKKNKVRFDAAGSELHFAFNNLRRYDLRVRYTRAELDLPANKEFASDRLSQVRDTFLFCCFTGLAYSVVRKLEKSQIARGIDGEQWIFYQQMKTNVKSHIPLLVFHCPCCHHGLELWLCCEDLLPTN